MFAGCGPVPRRCASRAWRAARRSPRRARRRARGRRRGRRPGGRRGSRRGRRRRRRCAAARSGSPSTSRRASEPQITTAAGSSARRALRKRPSARPAESSSTRRPARRRNSSSACTWTDSTPERRAGVEQQDALVAGRAGGEAAGAVQPAGRPAAGVLELGGAVGAPLGELERRQQQLGDAALDRAHREALLELAVGAGLVEAVEGGDQAGGGGGAAAALAGDLDRARDVVGLAQRLAQRLDLVELVEAVVARACGAGWGSRGGAPSSAGCWC